MKAIHPLEAAHEPSFVVAQSSEQKKRPLMADKHRRTNACLRGAGSIIDMFPSLPKHDFRAHVKACESAMASYSRAYQTLGDVLRGALARTVLDQEKVRQTATSQALRDILDSQRRLVEAAASWRAKEALECQKRLAQMASGRSLKDIMESQWKRFETASRKALETQKCAGHDVKVEG